VILLTTSVVKLTVPALSALVYVGALHVCKVTYGMYILRLQIQITALTLLYRVVCYVVSEKCMASVFRVTLNYNNHL
jgi:hypothetical protein